MTTENRAFTVRAASGRTLASLLLAFLLRPATSSATELPVESAEMAPMVERMAPPAEGGTGLCGDLVRGQTGLAEIAIANGSKLDAPDPADPGHRPPLVCAAEAGQAASVAFLLAKGAKVDVAHRGLLGPETPLVVAAAKGHGEVVKLLLRAGASVKARSGGWTALMFAAQEASKPNREGYLAALTALLDAGADPNARSEAGETALTLAIANRNPAGAVLLASRGADPNRRDGGGRTPLSLAAEREEADGAIEMIAALLAAGAKVDGADRDGKTAWIRAAEKGNRAAMDRLVAAGAKERYGSLDAVEAFRSGAAAGDVALMKRLLGKRTRDVAKGGRFAKAIGDAAAGGHLDAVRFLLASGADPNARSDRGSPPLVSALTDYASDARGAAARGEVAAALVGKGADVNARGERGETPLLAAVTWGNPAAVKLLLSKGADPNLADEDGRVALGVATGKGDAESVKALLDARADPEARGRDGRSAWTIATEKGDRATAALLEKAGAKADYASMRWEGKESEIATLWQGAVTTEVEWSDLWRRAFGKEAPPMDFTRYFVACAFLGHEAGWWYAIGFQEAVVGDGRLTVDYTLTMLQVESTPDALRSPGFRGQYAMRAYPKRAGLEIVVRGHAPEGHLPGLGEGDGPPVVPERSEERGGISLLPSKGPSAPPARAASAPRPIDPRWLAELAGGESRFTAYPQPLGWQADHPDSYPAPFLVVGIRPESDAPAGVAVRGAKRGGADWIVSDGSGAIWVTGLPAPARGSQVVLSGRFEMADGRLATLRGIRFLVAGERRGETVVRPGDFVYYPLAGNKSTTIPVEIDGVAAEVAFTDQRDALIVRAVRPGAAKVRFFSHFFTEEEPTLAGEASLTVR